MDSRSAAESTHAGMGTDMTHRAFGINAKEAIQAVEREAKRLEHMLSRFLPESDTSRINRSAGVKREPVSPDIYKILSFATECSEISQGLFDITVGPLADVWDYKHATEPPADVKIRQVLPLVDYRCLKLDQTEQTAELKKAGQSVDLGGIGKGFAGDRFMEIFRQYGVASAFSNIGGNVSTLGNKPDGSPWRVGIRHPRQAGLLGTVDAAGKAVVTSGDYERFFTDRNGRRFHHILNPVTGYPAESRLISVTVTADSAMTADALSTAIFIAGAEKGLDFIGSYKQAEAVLVNAELSVYVTRGLRKCFRAAPGIKIKYI